MPREFELHAAEIKSPHKATKKQPASPWLQIDYRLRMTVLRNTFGVLAGYAALDAAHPIAFFAAVVDRRFPDRDERAYEEVLHKFDEMLTRQGHASGRHEAGIVIHNRRLILERDIQLTTERWRHVAGRIGTLTHLADVPFFADSRASRLIQASDFVTWALWRYYGSPRDDRWIKRLWARFDADRGTMHGLIHASPDFRTCHCPPCESRH
jgi:Protein of unknown function (DUF3800)